MDTDISITKVPFIRLEDGTTAHRIPVGGDSDWLVEDCISCGAKQGEYHDEGCDCETCPVCGLQMLTCGCWDAYTDKKNLSNSKMQQFLETA